MTDKDIVNARRPLAALLSFLPFLSTSVLAQEWSVVGAKAMGMGGAGVASARGGAATYWNPAALAYQGTPGNDDGGFAFNLGGGLSLTLINSGDTLSDLDRLHDDIRALDLAAIEAKFSSGTPLTEAELRSALRVVALDLPELARPGDGLLLDAIAGPYAQFERFGVSILASLHGGATSNFDFSNLAFGNSGIDSAIGPGSDRSAVLTPAGQALADSLAAGGNVTQNQAEELVFQSEQAGADSSNQATQDVLTNIVNATAANVGGPASEFFTNNQSGATIKGIFVQEVALGYGQPIISDFLALGVAFKLMSAFTFSKTYTLRDTPEAKDLPFELYELRNTEDSLNIGLDAGALFTPLDWIAVGITGKNLNRPSFEEEDGGHTTLDPTARIGVAVYPLPFLSFAADMDLYHYQSDVLPGYRSQVLGGGASLDFGWVALQAGLSKNLLDPEEDILVHGGLWFQWWYFNLQLAAALTPEFHPIDSGGSVQYPERAGLALSLGFNIPW